jgi:hypothetical protein
VSVQGASERRLRAWLEYVIETAIDMLDALDAGAEDREDDELGDDDLGAPRRAQRPLAVGMLRHEKGGVYARRHDVHGIVPQPGFEACLEARDDSFGNEEWATIVGGFHTAPDLRDEPLKREVERELVEPGGRTEEHRRMDIAHSPSLPSLGHASGLEAGPVKLSLLGLFERIAAHRSPRSEPGAARGG